MPELEIPPRGDILTDTYWETVPYGFDVRIRMRALDKMNVVDYLYAMVQSAVGWAESQEIDCELAIKTLHDMVEGFTPEEE